MPSQTDRYKGLASFRYTLRRFLAASEQLCHDAGVTAPQYQAMLAIKAHDGDAMSMRDLADHLLLTHHAAVQLVDRLGRNDLASRAPSRDDRRSVVLMLTPKGEALVDDLAGKHLSYMVKLEPQLSKSLKGLKRLT